MGRSVSGGWSGLPAQPRMPLNFRPFSVSGGRTENFRTASPSPGTQRSSPGHDGRARTAWRRLSTPHRLHPIACTPPHVPHRGRGERSPATLCAVPFLERITLVVDEYDPAIAFFVGVLGFELLEDSPSETDDGRPK